MGGIMRMAGVGLVDVSMIAVRSTNNRVVLFDVACIVERDGDLLDEVYNQISRLISREVK